MKTFIDAPHLAHAIELINSFRSFVKNETCNDVPYTTPIEKEFENARRCSLEAVKYIKSACYYQSKQGMNIAYGVLPYSLFVDYWEAVKAILEVIEYKHFTDHSLFKEVLTKAYKHINDSM